MALLHNGYIRKPLRMQPPQTKVWTERSSGTGPSACLTAQLLQTTRTAEMVPWSAVLTLSKSRLKLLCVWRPGSHAVEPALGLVTEYCGLVSAECPLRREDGSAVCSAVTPPTWRARFPHLSPRNGVAQFGFALPCSTAHAAAKPSAAVGPSTEKCSELERCRSSTEPTSLLATSFVFRHWNRVAGKGNALSRRCVRQLFQAVLLPEGQGAAL
jgi:hypothetical protein